ncbi:MAG: tRNA pseudouridine(38-40) synthase TruA [Candidatus Dormiibacterota bacterium]
MRLVLEYDGTDFHGWQAQPAGRTVAGELSRAIATITGESPRLIAAGRTDAGAHSLGQTVNFELVRDIAPGRLMAGLNAVLPADVAVVDADIAPQGFHARFSARRRRYRYVVENREARSTVLRNHAWQVKSPLDVEAMRQAAGRLTGRRDLSAFGKDPAGRNTVRTLDAVDVTPLAAGGVGALIAFDLSADAFLYGMVRRIVGFLVEVGSGRRSADDVAAGARVAPARGLYQLAVEY